MSHLTQTIFMWAIALFYGFLVILKVIQTIYKEGFKRVFRKVKHERPAGLDDPALGTHGFLYLENIRIHYVASGSEDKPLMLFLHGFPEFWYSWRHQILEFQKDYRCVAIDMRGYGESDKPPGLESYLGKNFMTDVKQVIVGLGYKSCILVGHDYGGTVAWAFGRHFPDMVDKLIILNVPPVPVLRKVIKTIREQSKMSWYMIFFMLPYLPEFYLNLDDLGLFDKFKSRECKEFVNPLSDEEVEAYKYTFSQSGTWTQPLNGYRASFRIAPMIYDLNYSIPILLIWGMKDIYLSSANVDEIEKSLPKVTVKRIPNAGHFVQSDTPDTVNQLMREWLSSKD